MSSPTTAVGVADGTIHLHFVLFYAVSGDFHGYFGFLGIGRYSDGLVVHPPASVASATPS